MTENEVFNIILNMFNQKPHILPCTSTTNLKYFLLYWHSTVDHTIGHKPRKTLVVTFVLKVSLVHHLPIWRENKMSVRLGISLINTDFDLLIIKCHTLAYKIDYILSSHKSKQMLTSPLLDR